MDRAAEVALTARVGRSSDLKKDGSIVTSADKAVEEFLRIELAKAWPGTSFWGEEFGRDVPTEAGYWLIDPIDGTSNFAFGSPLWGISVGLAVAGQLELGAIWLPDLKETYLAERGKGAWSSGAEMSQIPPGPIQTHQLVSYHDAIARWYTGQGFPGKMRCSGAFVIDGTFTAQQRFRGLIGRGEYLYDAAASILINEELGADVRWADGSPLELGPLLDGQSFGRAWLIFPRDSDFTLTEPL